MVARYRLCILQLILSACHLSITRDVQPYVHEANCTKQVATEGPFMAAYPLGKYGFINTYYPDRIFRSNTTALFTDLFPVIGTTVTPWKAFNALTTNERKDKRNFERHPFGEGVFVTIKHTQVSGPSTPPMYLFGTYFNSSSYTLAISLDGLYRRIEVCNFQVCQNPVMYYAKVSNPAQGNPLIYSQRAYTDYNSCVSQTSQSFNITSQGDKNGAFSKDTITTYVFKYQNGIFSVFHGFHNGTDHVPYPKPAFEFPLDIPITHFIIPPTVEEPAQGQGYTRGNYVVYYAQLKKSTFMFGFDSNGLITRYIDCAAGPKDELMCSQGSFNITPGVYTTTNYRATPKQHVVITSADVSAECPFQSLINVTEATIPSPAFWRRHYVRNCNYDISVFTDNADVYSLQCYGVAPSSLADMCWEEAHIDYMKISEKDIFSFKPSGAGDFAKYNYKLPSDFMGCTVVFTNQELTCNATSGQLCHVYTNNLTNYPAEATAWDKSHYESIERYQMWSSENVYNCELQEVGPQQFNRMPRNCYVRSNNSNDYWQPMSFRGVNSLMVAMAITLKPTRTSATVCGYKQKTTPLVLNECITYHIYGYKGTGVIVSANYTFQSFQTVQLTSTGSLHSFKYNNTIYGILPCAQAQVSIVTAGSNHDNVAVVYNGLGCNAFQSKMQGVDNTEWSVYTNFSSPIDTPVGCLTGAIQAQENSTECQFALGLDSCVNYTADTRLRTARAADRALTFNYMYFAQELPSQSEQSVAFDNSTLQIPINFTIGIEYETIPVTMPKVTVDCAQYVCGDNSECRTLLVQYGTFCETINDALRGVALQQDVNQKDVFSSVRRLAKVSSPMNLGNLNGFNFSSILNQEAINGNNFQARSAIEDLFFDKIETADVGFQKKYDECTGGSVVKDLGCAQSFNGLMVLPPQMTDAHVAAYTTSAALGSFFSIPNTMQMAYRFNGIAVTQKVLVDNQKQIANKFNQAMMSVQTGFKATSSALEKLQKVVNDNAQALNNLVAQLTNNFGAISSAINDITQRLDKLEADAQIDRLINGRLQVLQTFVTQQLIRASEIRASAKLAAQKMSECVQGQSQRLDFCGRGMHLMSFPQAAPYGMVFLHVLYKPTDYINVTTVPAICSNDVAYFPVDGVFVYYNNSLMFTKRNYFEPEIITIDNIRSAGSCNVDVTYVNHTIYNPEMPELEDFKQELEEIRKNFSTGLPNRPNFTLPGLEGINASMVDLSEEVKILNDVVKELNASLINLQELGVNSQYIKWPWYIWLGFIAGLIAIVMATIMLCCMTSCCSCFKGLCACKRCCDSFDEPDEPIKYHYP
ncbi:spike protein [Bat Hp-betacoronavirus/Zhejiang2013]|uniref:Spike glycoprotein n=1 Tax=Bat Hp-betacoronavirus/Zhejiang2013 TaxID=1541205 RepID=A0A088DJY6_9BETC|nr:spike protein [Bat Hp-betacoronavirus/Zhejiang2013]AIL94216.1 spike protein [Bat Hp-betacoronavirus/Zhejiang2013]